MKKRIYTRGTAIDRIIEHIVLSEDGCWIYDGARTPAGYGHVNIGNRKYRHAHRITYEHFVEPSRTEWNLTIYAGLGLAQILGTWNK